MTNGARVKIRGQARWRFEERLARALYMAYRENNRVEGPPRGYKLDIDIYIPPGSWGAMIKAAIDSFETWAPAAKAVGQNGAGSGSLLKIRGQARRRARDRLAVVLYTAHRENADRVEGAMYTSHQPGTPWPRLRLISSKAKWASAWRHWGPSRSECAGTALPAGLDPKYRPVHAEILHATISRADAGLDWDFSKKQPADAQESKKHVEHRIDVECTHYTSTGEHYRVIYLGETLLEGARTPLFDACRALLARGVTGTLVMYSRGGTVPRAKVDIEKGAESTIIENAKEGPRLGRYRPYPSRTGEDEAE